VLISQTIAKVKINELTKMLVEIDLGTCTPEINLPQILEHFFEYHAIRGFAWKSRQQPSFLGCGSRNGEWEKFQLQLRGPLRKSVYFKHMQENALYYPKYPNFPLVDFYHKDINDKLFGIQVTISSKHPKKIAVYESFYD
jgi:hypothetical protein